MNNNAYGLLGHPLGHSFSPRIHGAFGNRDYGLFDLTKEELPDFFARRAFSGCNVTIPYKQTVIPYLTSLSSGAAKIGAVNTIVKGANGSLTGHNTDYDGMKYALDRAGILVRGGKALVLGSGGTSHTACAVLADMGADEIFVVSRHPHADALINSRPSIDTQKQAGGAPVQISYEQAYKFHPDADILINTTPVGMYPNNGIAPVDLHRFPNLRGVMDVIYNPLRSALLLQAEELGIPCTNGLPMLVAQAAAAHLLYAQENPDLPVPAEAASAQNSFGTASGIAKTGSADGFRKAAPDGLYSEDSLAAITRPVLHELQTEYTNIILIGMPGSGKTTIGKALAEKLGRIFVDLDERIEEADGRHPSAIITQDGEDAFRRIESEICAKEGKETGRVIATGGGIVLRNENYASLRQNGKIFLLERDLNLLPTNGRPLSKSPDVLRGMARIREPFYQAFADVVIDNSSSLEDTVDLILRKL